MFASCDTPYPPLREGTMALNGTFLTTTTHRLRNTGAELLNYWQAQTLSVIDSLQEWHSMIFRRTTIIAMVSNLTREVNLPQVRVPRPWYI
jgi:hypothetical protein